MIFPELGPAYYDEKDRSILQRMEAFYSQSITINASYWGEGDTDLRFYMNDQTLWNDLYGNLPANRRRQFCFNRIQRVVNMISGYQRRNRKSMVATPVENADDETADQFTKVLIWINNQEDVLESVSEAFQSALITGLSFLQLWVDYRSDPVSGNVKLDVCPYNYFIVDPYFKKHDLSDCNGLWRRSFISKREVISLMPDHEEQILGLQGLDNRDGKFQFAAESYNYGLKNLLTYDEFYYRDFRKQKMLLDTQTGETQEWKSPDDEALRAYLRAYPEVTVINSEIPTVRLAIVVQGKVFYDGPNPIGIDSYPFVPVFGMYHPESPYFPYRIQGVVRGLRDAQYLYNRRKVIELDILESQINSGFKYKEDALVNPKDIFLSGQGRGLALKSEAQMTDVEQIIPPAIPPSVLQLSEILGREINEIAGISDELLGTAVDDKAGILSMLRQGAGLTTLMHYFDNLDKSQKLLGKKMLDIIQANFVPAKIQRILETQPAAQFYNKAFGKYNIVVEDGLNTTTQKQMQLAQLLHLREVGVPIPDSILIESATVQNKKQLMQVLEQQQQAQQQAQQQQMQSALQEQQARTDLAKARTVADQGLGLERVSRIQENKALAEERRAAAVKDEEIGLLNLVKALKELDSVNIDQIHKLITLSQTMHLSTSLETGSEVQNVQSTST